MKAIILSLILICMAWMNSPAQSAKIEIDLDKINISIQEAMEQVKIALEEIEIPEIDFSGIAEEIEEAIPSDEEMEEIEKEIKICLKNIEDIDFSEFKEAMKEVEEALKDIEIDIRISDKDDPPKKNKKDN